MIWNLIEQKRDEMRIVAQREARQNLLLGMAVGATAGLLGGLLLAPKAGKETREDISRRTQELAQRAHNMSEATRNQVESQLAKLKGRVEEDDSEEAEEVLEVSN